MKKHKQFLVTGAGGFIGSHLTEILIDKGYRVNAFLRYSSSGNVGNLMWIGKKIPTIKSDLWKY